MVGLFDDGRACSANDASHRAEVAMVVSKPALRHAGKTMRDRLSRLLRLRPRCHSQLVLSVGDAARHMGVSAG